MENDLLQKAHKSIGELLISGIAGLELAPETADWIRYEQIGGIILFAPNYESPAQLAELSADIQAARSPELPPLWISVDQEGGRVQRFKKGFTRLPDAQTLGQIRSPKGLFEISEVIATELRAVGINLNFAPVADILTEPKNPVIGNRSFDSDPENVSRCVSAFVRGHLTQKVQPCLKHFPGHGDTHLDSHFALPTVSTELATLQAREFLPFIKGFKSRCRMVMTAHILCEKIDSQLPATLSQKVLNQLLRLKLGFDGLIISDDMEMKAISDHFGTEQAPVRAIEAGCDLLIYRSAAGAKRALQALRAALDDRVLTPERILESVERSQKLKREVLTDLPLAPVMSELAAKVGTAQHQELIQKTIASTQ